MNNGTVKHAKHPIIIHIVNGQINLMLMADVCRMYGMVITSHVERKRKIEL